MTIYYSGALNGFLDDSVHEDIPEDAVEVSDDRHQELMEAQASGFTIFADDNGAPALLAPSLPDPKDVKRAAVDALAAQKLDAGYPTNGGLHIALDGDTRADLGAMATTAALVLSNVTTWSESYSRGWITIENVRIPLPSPQDGIALAAAVGDYYAQLRQHARDLKDAIIAANNETALDAIDINAGWPAALSSSE